MNVLLKQQTQNVESMLMGSSSSQVFDNSLEIWHTGKKQNQMCVP